MLILRGEIYFVELGPTRGKELDTKRRPAVVLSINDLNSKPLVVTVVPGTTYRNREPYRSEVKVDPSDSNGLQAATLFQCFQLKALDHSRFDRDPVGELEAEDLSRIEEVTKLCLGLP